MFGGSLFAMTDPFYALMLQHNLGADYTVWVKSAEIEFVAPGRIIALASFQVSPEKLAEIRAATEGGQKYQPAFSVAIGAGVDGVVKRILVHDGQVVAAGIPLVQLNCDDLEARKKQAVAEVESALEQRKRILRGVRDEERRAAHQRKLAAEAVLQEAQSRFGRAQELSKAQVISDQQYDQVLRELDVARAQLDEARSQETLTLAGPLPEEEAKSNADVDSTRYQLDVVNKQLDKCTVRAPSNGTVLRILAKPGETFSTVMPKPLVKFADLSTTRVRAEVDDVT